MRVRVPGTDSGEFLLESAPRPGHRIPAAFVRLFCVPYRFDILLSQHTELVYVAGRVPGVLGRPCLRCPDGEGGGGKERQGWALEGHGGGILSL